MNSDFFDNEIFIIPEDNKMPLNLDDKIEMVVVCKDDDYTENESLIINILKAISFDLNTNASLLKLEDQELVHLSRRLPGHLNYVICFGLKPKEIGFNAGFRANRFYKTETFSILLTHSLAQLTESKKHKMALWNALQSTFKA